jgi:hypothetical protein
MASDITQERQQVHALLERLSVEKLNVVRNLLEVMVDDEGDEELTEEDRRAIAASRDYFEKGGEGISFEQVVADLGFTMDQVRGNKAD